MSDKSIIWMGAALLALGVSGCTKPETTTKTVTRKPLDTKKPLAPQLFPTPATNNAWFHVITTSDELKFNAKLSQADDVTNLAKSSPKSWAMFFNTEPAKSLVTNLVSNATLTATSPRLEKSRIDSVMVPPDIGRFRAVTRFLTAAMVTAAEQEDSRLASDIAIASLRLAQAPSGESNAGISTSLACEMLILTELCRLADKLAPDDLEAIATAQLLPSALNKSRFTPGLRSDYAILEALLASDDFIDVLASQMTNSTGDAVVKKKVAELKTNPDQVGLSRLQIKMHAQNCEQTLMHVVGQPMEFMRTKFRAPPKETYGIVEMMQSLEGSNAANVITSITFLRAAGLYLKAVALHKRTGKWPRVITELGSDYDIIEPISGRPLLLIREASGVRIRASKGMPIVFGVSRGELSVGRTNQIGNASK
jgi:uncharacterized lipoprotein YmbA